MEQIGRYQVLEEVGRGAMGAVYKAQAPGGQVVAIKVLLRGLGATAAQRTRFQREARALGKVEHRNVARLLDLGEHRGTPFVVTEFYSEGSLQEVLRSTVLHSEMVARIGRQIASGLAACHAQGVLHRDIKPDNVLLGQNGFAILTDFGLAKDLDREGETQRLTRSGVFLGTPGFWAPEQAAGKVNSVRPATDVYGLGATLYAALTGQPPITGESLIEVLAATTDQAPTPIRALAPSVSESLAATIMRCLEKDPADRWASASELGEALRDSSLSREPPRSAASRLQLVGAPLAIVALGGIAIMVTVRQGGLPPRGVANTGPPRPSVSASQPSIPADFLAQADAAIVEGRSSEALILLERAAESGRVDAMFRLGRVLSTAKDRRDRARGHEWYLRAAEKGHTSAMVSLGRIRKTGADSERNEARALRWFREAADAGDVEAMVELARCLAEGVGGASNERQAVWWFRRAAKEGSSEGMVDLARHLREGRGAAKDEAQAARWFRRAAKEGSPRGMVELAECLRQGLGLTSDAAEGTRWLRRAAELGDSRGSYNLGVCYDKGVGVPRDEAQAVRCYREAAVQGHVLAMGNLGLCLERGRGVAKDEVEAVQWYRRASMAGNSSAMANLGACLQKGVGVSRDAQEGARWNRRAADAGEVVGMFNLGLCLESGQGVVRNDREAVDWFSRAAVLGYSPAMVSLGEHFQRGEGVPKDEARAALLYRQAAERRQPLGMVRLAECLRLGLGVAQDEVEAVSWYERAAATRHRIAGPMAEEALRELRRRRD